jgi:hypothetical protein
MKFFLSCLQMVWHIYRGLNNNTPSAPQEEQEEDLIICPSCGCDFVNPVRRAPVDDGHWWIELRCGACEDFRESFVTNAVAERFGVELDRRADLIHRALAKLEHTHMEKLTARFTRALELDLIDAGDFESSLRQ